VSVPVRVPASAEQRPIPAASLGARFKAWRDGLLGDARFQRWASGFALTRPVARRHAGELFDLCAGFIYSQVLLACVRLQLLELLRAGPLTLAQIARQLALPTPSARALLAAAQALGLLEARGAGQWGLGSVGAALLGNPSVLRMIEHHPMLYDDLRDPVALLRDPTRSSRLAQWWPYARNEAPATLAPEQVSAYTALMASTQPLVAEELLDAYPFARHRCLLDVGGGDGSFLAAAGARVPQLRLMLFDLPGVAAQARLRLEAAGLGARAEVFGGDFAAGELPAGADLITLVRVLHDHDDDPAMALLRAARGALPRGGRIVLAEPMTGVRGAIPGTEAYFAFYLLAMGQGRARSAADVAQMLRTAGFRQPRLHRSARPWQCAVLSASAG
jgi:demethylspheroidene O-methyltransferase